MCTFATVLCVHAYKRIMFKGSKFNNFKNNKNKMKKLLFTLLLAAGTLTAWADEYYLVGGATDSGWTNGEWNRSAVRAYTADGTTWAWAGKLTTGSGDDGRFKLPNAAESDGTWSTGLWATSQDYELTSDYPENPNMTTSNSVDNKFRVGEEGYYLVTFNTSTMKIKAEKLTAPSKNGDYFLISSVNDYYYFAAYIATDATKNAKARLMADLSFEGKTFTPMASDKHKFKGEFDGNGHTIDYARVVSTSFGKIGLFSYVADGANIHDLIMGKNCRFEGTVKTGGIAGYARDGGVVTLTNVINNAAAVSTGGSSGNEGNSAGFIACATDNTIITATNCANMGLVSGQNGQCAAFAGWTQDRTVDEVTTNTTFTNCWNSGTIYNTEGDAQLYRNSGKVTATNCYDASTSASRGQGTLLTTADAASGNLCFLLNGRNISGTNWYQTIDTDTHPFPFSSHGILTAPTATDGWYEISKPWQLYFMANGVNESNSTYNGANIKLTADIDYSAYTDQASMFGKPSNTYKGTFDGQCHTVTVAFNNTAADESGLFRRINGGTIKNLKVAGSITTDKDYAGGICSGIWQGGYIQNCESAVTITDSRTAETKHGGILAKVWDLTSGRNVYVQNCLFSGTFSASNCTGCAGIVGITTTSDTDKDYVHIKNNLVTGTLGFKNANTNDVIVCNKGDLDKNYYTCTVGSNIIKTKATEASSKKGTGELCYLLNGSTSGGTNWYQNLIQNVDATPVPFNTHRIVYKNGDDYSNLILTDGNIQIGNAVDLDEFATLVNAGSTALNAKLTDNITASSDFIPIGDDSHRYTGNFNGNYKSIKLSINRNADNQGLFGAITNGAYIHDVTVTGSVKGGNYVAGIVGSVRGEGGSVNISNCKNEAAINGGQNTAGIVGVNVWPGENKSYCKTNILYCCNTGNITGTSHSALISGWIGDGSIKYTYAIGTIAGEEVGVDREFTRYQSCDFYANATMTGSTNTGGAVYFNPNETTYSINNADEFLPIATMVNVGGQVSKNFNLTANIDLNGKEYMPIGSDNNRYVGTLDGQGHKIMNLTIDSSTKEQGLFSVCAGGATIKNLTIDSSCSITGKSTANIGNAAFVAVCNGSGTLTFQNCGNEANVVGYNPSDAQKGSNSAAFLGVNHSTGDLTVVVKNCYNTGTIGDDTHGRQDAVIVGWNGGATLSVENFYNTGEVKHKDDEGRTLARGGGSLIYKNCYNTQSDTSGEGRVSNYDTDKVTSGELCAKLGYAFRQTVGSGHPCFDQSLGFVNQISAAGYSTQYNTYSDVTIPGTIEAFAGVRNGTEWLRLVSIEDNIAKDEPVILRGNAGLYNFMPTTGISRAANNDLSGSDGSATGGDGIYALAKKGEVGSEVVGFYPVGSGVTIPAGKAYLAITEPGGGNVKGYTFVFDDDATAIEMVNGQSSMVNGQPIFNLSGQRINKMQKGINIVNGRKVLY